MLKAVSTDSLEHETAEDADSADKISVGDETNMKINPRIMRSR